MPIPSWKDHKEILCKKMIANKSVLKIVLKTKDEVVHLQAWIDHHLKIVGPENLIVFDNGSTSDEVRDIYSRYSDIKVVRYDGAVDNIHHTRLFPELYEGLRQSSSFYAVIDTDERLVWVDGDRYFNDSEVVRFLQNEHSGNSFPGFWLQNILGWSNRFAFNTREDVISGLKWGKPIISSKLNVSGFINHNIQLGSDAFRSPRANIFVLHLNRLTPTQRIDANVRKLISLGLVPSDSSAQSIVESDFLMFREGNPRNYVKEIQLLAKKTGKFREGDSNVVPVNQMEFTDCGKVNFGRIEQRLMLENLLTKTMSYTGSSFFP
jgi:hypothetical protein